MQDPVGHVWPRKGEERALEPEIPICDAHHHLWAHRGTYLLDDFLADAACGHRIVSTIFMASTTNYRDDGPEELRPVGETAYVEEVADQAGIRGGATPVVAAGIVGFVDLTRGIAAAPVMEAHLATSPSRFRGIRHATPFDPSGQIRTSAPDPRPGLLLDATFRSGFSLLERYRLTFDAWVYHHQLPEVVSLARAFPATRIVVDHVGGPLGVGPYAGRRDEVFRSWCNSMEELATCPNVYVKIGGFGMPMMGFDWHAGERPPKSEELARAIAPWVHACIDRLGPGRCMFESNFPVDKASYSYVVLWNALKRLTAGVAGTERAALFHDTAIEAYGLRGARGRAAQVES